MQWRFGELMPLARCGFSGPLMCGCLSGLMPKQWSQLDGVCLSAFRFSPEAASRRGLSTAEMNAVEAIHRAVEFNPHVPKVSRWNPRRSSL